MISSIVAFSLFTRIQLLTALRTLRASACERVKTTEIVLCFARGGEGGALESSSMELPREPSSDDLMSEI